MVYVYFLDRGAEGLGSLYRILSGEGDAPGAPPVTVTPPSVDEQDEADGDSEDNEEEQ